MGDKYVIEIDGKFNSENLDSVLYRAKNFKSLVFDDYGLSQLEPLDYIIKQAQEEAWNLACRVVRNTGIDLLIKLGIVDRSDLQFLTSDEARLNILNEHSYAEIKSIADEQDNIATAVGLINAARLRPGHQNLVEPGDIVEHIPSGTRGRLQYMLNDDYILVAVDNINNLEGWHISHVKLIEKCCDTSNAIDVRM